MGVIPWVNFNCDFLHHFIWSSYFIKRVVMTYMYCSRCHISYYIILIVSRGNQLLNFFSSLTRSLCYSLLIFLCISPLIMELKKVYDCGATTAVKKKPLILFLPLFSYFWFPNQTHTTTKVPWRYT